MAVRFFDSVALNGWFPVIPLRLPSEVNAFITRQCHPRLRLIANFA